MLKTSKISPLGNIFFVGFYTIFLMPKYILFLQVTIAQVTTPGVALMLMNAQSHPTSARMEPHVLIPLAHMIAPVLLVTVAMEQNV